MRREASFRGLGQGMCDKSTDDWSSSIASQRTRPNDEYKSIAVPMRVLSPPRRTDIQAPVPYTNTT